MSGVMYLVRCQVCDAKTHASSVHDAAREGWGFAEIRFRDRVRHVSTCPNCVPLWLKDAAAGGKYKPTTAEKGENDGEKGKERGTRTPR